jgi:hypothetical protein
MITVWVRKHWLSGPINRVELRRHLLRKGLDVDKGINDIFECSRWSGMFGFQGTALPDRVVGIIRTVIGVVPITVPWEGAE